MTVPHNPNRPMGLSQGWPQPLNRDHRWKAVKVTVLNRKKKFANLTVNRLIQVRLFIPNKPISRREELYSPIWYMLKNRYKCKCFFSSKSWKVDSRVDTRAGDNHQTNSPRKKYYSPVWYILKTAVRWVDGEGLLWIFIGGFGNGNYIIWQTWRGKW